MTLVQNPAILRSENIYTILMGQVHGMHRKNAGNNSMISLKEKMEYRELSCLMFAMGFKVLWPKVKSYDRRRQTERGYVNVCLNCGRENIKYDFCTLCLRKQK